MTEKQKEPEEFREYLPGKLAGKAVLEQRAIDKIWRMSYVMIKIFDEKDKGKTNDDK